MFVTTAGRTTEAMIAMAKQVAKDLGIKYIPRKKRSISLLQEIEKDGCIVAGKERLELYPLGEKEPFFFHPNSAMFRIKRLLKGEHDPFIDAARLQHGMSVIDCTLGLASDSIVASFAVGLEGRVTGLEVNPFLAYVVKQGLSNWDSGLTEMNEAMTKISVHNIFALDFLKTQKGDSADCVYLDPMFEEAILESDGIRGLSRISYFGGISEELIREAVRVAKKRVILKDHFRSTRFTQFGFVVQLRKSAKFHYGVLEKH
ncbi:class I SAM-dependent methyltransferase [Bacillus sp. T33-2]|uniref:class I SAM-dependent methyltransferase n=1 Tax=Bacillus sp. T33-2 TaxID=2054168 RepID=UPI000C76D63B|nr:class I SAM-dependent methyltransferase [Bacillus sp. T33-2]PLR98909.1 hypothetical protein CVD19_04580 [Bacillus sp. T33-2]